MTIAILVAFVTSMSAANPDQPGGVENGTGQEHHPPPQGDQRRDGMFANMDTEMNLDSEDDDDDGVDPVGGDDQR